MVSRDTTVSLLAIAVGAILAILWVQFGPTGAYVSTAFVLVLYLLIFAGPHAYLAVRGEDGDITVSARWRFVRFVLLAVSLMAIGGIFSDTKLFGVWISRYVRYALLTLFAGYFLYEAREAYRDSRERYRST